jgi:hypothetical protein
VGQQQSRRRRRRRRTKRNNKKIHRKTIESPYAPPHHRDGEESKHSRAFFPISRLIVGGFIVKGETCVSDYNWTFRPLYSTWQPSNKQQQLCELLYSSLHQTMFLDTRAGQQCLDRIKFPLFFLGAFVSASVVG